MTLDRASLTIVLDEQLGWELRPLAEAMPVHVVDSPQNRPAIESIWNDRRLHGAEREVTVFRTIPELGPAEHLIRVLRTLGGESFGTLHVIGLALDPGIEDALEALGIRDCRPEPSGFRARNGAPRPGRT